MYVCACKLQKNKTYTVFVILKEKKKKQQKIRLYINAGMSSRLKAPFLYNPTMALETNKCTRLKQSNRSTYSNTNSKHRVIFVLFAEN